MPTFTAASHCHTHARTLRSALPSCSRRGWWSKECLPEPTTSHRHACPARACPARSGLYTVDLFPEPRQLKDDLNAQFRERWEELPPSLTLSKIRAVKREALLGCHGAGVEIATVALACVLFERLCLLRLVCKARARGGGVGARCCRVARGGGIFSGTAGAPALCSLHHDGLRWMARPLF